MKNYEFKTTYNTLDNYLKRLIGHNVKSGIAVYQQICSPKRSAELETIRQFKNAIISHNSVREEPEAPLSYTTILKECLKDVSKNEASIAAQLKSIDTDGKGYSKYKKDRPVYGYPSTNMCPGAPCNVEKFYFRNHDISPNAEINMSLMIEMANLIANYEGFSNNPFTSKNIIVREGMVNSFINLKSIKGPAYGVLMETRDLFAFFNGKKYDAISCIFGAKLSARNVKTFGLYYMCNEHITKMMNGAAVSLDVSYK